MKTKHFNRSYCYSRQSKSVHHKTFLPPQSLQSRKNHFIIQSKKKSAKIASISQTTTKKNQFFDQYSCDQKLFSVNFSNNISSSCQKKLKKSRLLTEPTNAFSRVNLNISNKNIFPNKQMMDKIIFSLQMHEQDLREISNLFKKQLSEQTLRDIQKILVQYYMSDFELLDDVEYIIEPIKSELYRLLNMQRTFMISALEFSLIQNIKSNLVLFKDFIKNLIDQYKNFQVAFNTNEFDKPKYQIITGKLKYKSRNYNLMIKAENFKLNQTLKKIISKLDIYSSLKQIFSTTDKVNPSQFWYLLKQYYAYHLTLLNLSNNYIKQSYWPLAICPQPYLPKSQNYTLVLDLDETLAHYNLAGEVLIRPYANQFLNFLKQYYEIVIFTAGMPDYADYILNHFDKKDAICYKLYRYHTSRINEQKSIKDLCRLGRPLQRLIMIDNIKQNYQKQLYNGIQIKGWYGDKQDNELQKLKKHLKVIVDNKMDVREYIKKVFY